MPKMRREADTNLVVAEASFLPVVSEGSPSSVAVPPLLASKSTVPAFPSKLSVPSPPVLSSAPPVPPLLLLVSFLTCSMIASSASGLGLFSAASCSCSLIHTSAYTSLNVSGVNSSAVVLRSFATSSTDVQINSPTVDSALVAALGLKSPSSWPSQPIKGIDGRPSSQQRNTTSSVFLCICPSITLSCSTNTAEIPLVEVKSSVDAETLTTCAPAASKSAKVLPNHMRTQRPAYPGLLLLLLLF
mmetsp:Transcript_10332/g.20713  ORF Transcript_10332/g.20713 Transcript_10332/m.20713 type:complete len:244 (-) Transcript_10332:413-1144(-)